MKKIKKVFILIVFVSLLFFVGCGDKIEHVHNYIDGVCSCGDKEVVVYTVIFKDYDGSILKEQKVVKNESAIAPNNPTREGYKFIGWSEEYTNITTDLIVIAQYEKNQEQHVHNYVDGVCSCGDKEVVVYTVIFKDYDGSILKEQKVVKNESAIAPNNPTREGYKFIGWSEEYTNITTDLIVIAQYEKNQEQHVHNYVDGVCSCGDKEVVVYTVTFDTKGGTLINSQKVADGKKIKKPESPIKDGYTFLGWYCYDEEWIFLDHTVSDDLILEAKWEIIDYNIIYENLNNAVCDNLKKYNVETESFELVEPVFKNRVFLGWTFEGQEEPVKEVKILKGTTGDKTFKANWYFLKLKEINNEYEIVGLYDRTLVDVVISDELNGMKITSIGKSAFFNCIKLTSIVIPKTITNIGESAFSNCTGLISINIPESVISIGKSAFSNCIKLTSIVIPKTTTNIGESAFSNCTGLISINIPESVTSIGESAFSNCTGLISINIPRSVTVIEESVFSGCNSITSIEVPDSVTSIGRSAFYKCNSLITIKIPFIGMSMEETENNYFGYIFGAYSNNLNDGFVPTSLKEVIVTGGTKVYDYAFYKCESITNIVLPETVTSIGVESFSGCTSLTSIDMPKNATIIERYAFSGCSSLKSIDIPENVTIIERYVFHGCTNLQSLVISENIIIIEKHAFSNCTNLKSIEIPQNVTRIGESAFENCTNLISITIPFIGETLEGTEHKFFGYIFGADNENYNDKYVPASLKEVILTGGTRIDDYAFYKCKSIVSIKIPKSVSNIGSMAFSLCTSLSTIIIHDGVTIINDFAFSGATSLTIYCVVASKPNEWHVNWNVSKCPVVWGYIE